MTRSLAIAKQVSLLFGIIVGTYSSIYVASTLLLYTKPLRKVFDQEGEKEAPTPPPAAPAR